MSKLKTLALFIGLVTLQTLSFTQDAVAVGVCHYLNHDKVLLTIANMNSDFKDTHTFAVYQDDVAEVLPQVEYQQLADLSLQIVTAERIYDKVLGLNPPLDKRRYQDAKRIVIYMGNIDGNGIAYDEVVANKRLGHNDCHISMTLTASLQATNATPMHELFHLYQNAYFMFKNGWLTEGTAKWAESLIADGVGDGVDTTLPQTTEQLQAVMQKRYDASQMWIRLFYLIDAQSEFNDPSKTNDQSESTSLNDLMDARYLNGAAVIADNHAYGIGFIKILFAELEKQSVKAAADYGWQAYNWKEADQKSTNNDVYIWQAIKDAVNKTVPAAMQSDELRQFVNISFVP